MTEQEAKTKWCPWARVGSSTTGLGGFNRFIPPDDADYGRNRVLCLGSGCAAWRWDFEFETDYDERGYRSGRHKEVSSESGYCGLAGRP